LSRDALISIVPKEIMTRTAWHGGEIVFSYPDVLQIVRLAMTAQIAVLGVETFEIVKDGLQVGNFSGYEVSFEEDWKQFVDRNNLLALEFIEQHRLGEDHGYILTSTSLEEYRQVIEQKRAMS